MQYKLLAAHHYAHGRDKLFTVRCYWPVDEKGRVIS